MNPVSIAARLCRRALRPWHAAAMVGMAALAPVPASASAVPLPPGCSVPDRLLSLPGRLGHVIARARSGAAVTVLAIGSSSTAGVGASAPDRTYPARLAVELSRRMPSARFTVLNRGVGGEVAAATAARLRREAAARPTDLVVWQVGTNDAVRGVATDSLARTVEEGISFLAQRGADVVLMDPQFYPGIADDAAYQRVVERVGALGRAAGVPVLARFAAMRHWARGAAAPSMLAPDAFHMNDLGYACVAAMLAEGIARRVEAAERSAPTAAARGPDAVPAPHAAKVDPVALTH
jgi:acyl-CoA thioesterase-1